MKAPRSRVKAEETRGNGHADMMGKEAIAKRPEASSRPQFLGPTSSPLVSSIADPWLLPGLFPFHMLTLGSLF